MTLRRVVAVAVAVGLALGGLVACGRSDPAVAAYVGDTEYTVAEIDEIYDELTERQPDTPVTRVDVLETLVVGHLVRSLATGAGVEIRQITADDVSQGEGVPADTQYAEVRAEMATHLLSWSGTVEVAPPTEQQMRDLHERAIAGGEEWAGEPFEQLVPILSGQQVAQAIAVRDELEAEAERLGVTVNPRFGPLEHAVLSFSLGSPAVVVTLGEGGTDAVESSG